MSSFKWFAWLFVSIALSSMLCGVAEMSYLGPYASEGVLAPFFLTYGTESTTDAGTVFALVMNPEVWTSIWDMLWWQYAVLETGLGAVIKVFLMFFSGAFAVSFLFMVASHLPFIGRGSS